MKIQLRHNIQNETKSVAINFNGKLIFTSTDLPCPDLPAQLVILHLGSWKISRRTFLQSI